MLLLLLLPTPALAHNEVVELTHIRIIELRDIGIEESALSPDGSDVLLVGLEGWAHLLDAVDPNVEVELNSNDEDDLRDVDWHPRGNTALIVAIRERCCATPERTTRSPMSLDLLERCTARTCRPSPGMARATGRTSEGRGDC